MLKEENAFTFQELHIVNSWLTRLPPSIKNLTSLTLLEIESSRITFLPDGVLEGMKEMKDLKIADSKLNKISASMFKGLPKLKRLSLYKNNITKLERVSSKNLFWSHFLGLLISEDSENK